ncbi:MAG: UvrD-helicase domain-containing protein [Blastocatellia bacterium]|nr:UvrD-helicase domain-containing protein [Blastocatellia bacterium]
MVDFLKTLNPQQREAVTTTEGPVLVLAGAGSGKTRVITYRIAYLIESCGVRPGNILAVTFTNKAAAEMKERIEKLIPPERYASSPLISTFHSFCVRLLRRNLHLLGGNYTNDFTIYDTDDQAKIVKSCLKDLHIDEKMLPPRNAQFAISGAKNHGQDWESFLKSNDPKKATIGRVFKLYEERLAANNALDFDDLLLKSVRILRKFPEVQEYYNNWFRYILIDEYQDTNPPQYALIRLLTQKQQNLCVVGDPDQSIYRFRAADIKNILDFENHYPGAKLIKLTENYRSTKTILSAANTVIKNNKERKEKDLFTANSEGEKIHYYQAGSGEAEADFIVNEILRWRRSHLGAEAQAAVLYRTNAQSRVLEEACRRVGLKYVLVGGFSFYQRAEIKDVIAYLKLVLNHTDAVAFERVINTPPRGIGKTTLDALFENSRREGLTCWENLGRMIEENRVQARAANALRAFKSLIEALTEQAEHLSQADLLKAVIKQSGYAKWLEDERSEDAEARLLNLEELVSAAAEAELRGETIRDFIDHAALVADTDALREDAQVTLMTIHAAKGLEFPLVFVAGMEEGLFPHQRSVASAVEMEEERRLFYVALTRAKKQLFITHAEWRRQYGDEVYNEPSRFLAELPLERLENRSRGDSWLARKNDDTRKRFIAVSGGNPEAGRAAAPKPAMTVYNSVDNVRDFFKMQQARKAAAAPASGSNYGYRQPEPEPKRSPAGTSGGFKAGDRVRHDKYGTGLILKREGDKLVINFPGYGVKKFVEAAAKLEKI